MILHNFLRKSISSLKPNKQLHPLSWGCLCYSQVAVNEANSESKALGPVQEDISHITPYHQKSFNIAAYVNKSETLQNLVKLKVNLSKIEKKPYYAEKFLKLDFDRDMKKHIIFLSDYIAMDKIGDLITSNPMIFYEKLEDLEVRINYLYSKKFDNNQIKRILTANHFWLMFSTVRIDRRFGYFQQTFDLSGNEIRCLTVNQPKLITYNLHSIKTNTFVIKEEIGFNDKEIKNLLLDKPKLWMLNHRNLLERFKYIHNTIKIPHEVLVENPEVLLSRVFRVKQRHVFLEKLGRAQYDPKKENYVPITALIKDTDVEFCKKYAKSNIDDFNTFLKTL